MTAVPPVLARFLGMLGVAAGIWLVSRIAYAAAADLPLQSVVEPSATNVAVVLVVCVLGAFSRKSK